MSPKPKPPNWEVMLTLSFCTTLGRPLPGLQLPRSVKRCRATWRCLRPLAQGLRQGKGDPRPGGREVQKHQI